MVVRRVLLLENVMDRYPGTLSREDLSRLPVTRDEIGRLTTKFHDLCHRLEVSQEELKLTQEQVFQNIRN